MLGACCWVISRALPPYFHVFLIVVFLWVVLCIQAPLVLLAHLFFFLASLVLSPVTRNLFGSSSCARFWKD